MSFPRLGIGFWIADCGLRIETEASEGNEGGFFLRFLRYLL
jgi:hypothetical protein